MYAKQFWRGFVSFNPPFFLVSPLVLWFAEGQNNANFIVVNCILNLILVATKSKLFDCFVRLVFGLCICNSSWMLPGVQLFRCACDILADSIPYREIDRQISVQILTCVRRYPIQFCFSRLYVKRFLPPFRSRFPWPPPFFPFPPSRDTLSSYFECLLVFCIFWLGISRGSGFLCSKFRKV